MMFCLDLPGIFVCEGSFLVGEGLEPCGCFLLSF